MIQVPTTKFQLTKATALLLLLPSRLHLKQKPDSDWVTKPICPDPAREERCKGDLGEPFRATQRTRWPAAAPHASFPLSADLGELPPQDAASSLPAHRCCSPAAPQAWLDTGREHSCRKRRELIPHSAALPAGSLAPRRKKFARFTFAGKPGHLARLPAPRPLRAFSSRDLEQLGSASPQ